jgi:amidophosphoribosyltransferase
MCGIIGVVRKDGNVIFDGIALLNAENHRGEQACGAAVSNKGNLRCYYGEGKIAEVFGARDQKKWSKLLGNACVMHTLYSTVGKSQTASQPKIKQPVAFKFAGIRGAVAHNGNLVRIEELRKQAKRAGYKFKSEISDTEVIAALLSISKRKTFLEALLEVLKSIEGKGAFSLVILYGGKLYGIRDQNGIRPLCAIKKNGKNGDSDSYIFASESCVFPTLDATRFIRDVDPGEIVVLGPDGIEQSIQWTQNICPKFCVCEYIYFSNPATRFGQKKVSVYAFRVAAGEMSAKKHPVQADVIVAVPDSGRGYSDGFSSESGIPLREGLIKSRYTVRTFMQPREIDRGQKQRAKLQALPDVMDGKSVCLVEDSVFRASVSPVVVKMSREHGRARRVHLRVGSPPVCHRCHLGLDTSTNQELIASRMTPAEIKDQIIHSDSLEYLTVEELKEVLRGLGLSPEDFCLGCFTREYPVAPPKD